MILQAHVPGSEPWTISPEYKAEELYCAFREAAEQTASDAGSELLESPLAYHREMLASQMFAEMDRHLREPGDQYRAPDGVLYTLEDNQPEETR